MVEASLQTVICTPRYGREQIRQNWIRSSPPNSVFSPPLPLRFSPSGASELARSDPVWRALISAQWIRPSPPSVYPHLEHALKYEGLHSTSYSTTKHTHLAQSHLISVGILWNKKKIKHSFMFPIIIYLISKNKKIYIYWSGRCPSIECSLF